MIKIDLIQIKVQFKYFTRVYTKGLFFEKCMKMTVRSWGQRGLEERPLQTTWSCQKQKPCLQRTDCSRHRRPVIIAYFSVPSGISEDSIKTQPTTATTDALMNLKVKQCTKGDKVQNQLLAEKSCEKSCLHSLQNFLHFDEFFLFFGSFQNSSNFDLQ